MRKPFLDNLRYSIVLLVIVYHICYLFNSVGVITNVAIPGIPAMDVVEYLLYPWFMVALFLISGICARYSLQKQTAKAFLKTKIRRQLVPSIAVIFLFGWTSGWVTGQYADMFGTSGDAIPGIFKYLIWCLSGIGVTWFLRQLFLADLVLLLIRKLDKDDQLPDQQQGGKANFPILCLLVFALWGSAQILNTPLIEVYRHGIYIFSFLLGYFVFSHDHIQDLLGRKAPFLLTLAGLLAVVYTVTAWGQNYAEPGHLKALLTNAYAWFGTLAVLSAGKRWLDKETGFTRCMAPRSFGFYLLHYPPLVLGAWAMDKLLHLPVWSMYPLLALMELILLPPLVAAIKRIPILRTLILGERW